MGEVKTPLTLGHDPLREALILWRAADHNTLQGSLTLFRLGGGAFRTPPPAKS